MPVHGGPGPDAEVEIGACPRPEASEAWGRFHAVEGGRALLQHGFIALALTQISGYVHPKTGPQPPCCGAWDFHRPDIVSIWGDQPSAGS